MIEDVNESNEQVLYCILGFDTNYDCVNDLDNKLGLISSRGYVVQSVECWVIKCRRIQNDIYKIVAAPVLKFGGENWIITKSKKDHSKIQIVDMRFIKR